MARRNRIPLNQITFALTQVIFQHSTERHAGLAFDDKSVAHQKWQTMCELLTEDEILAGLLALNKDGLIVTDFVRDIEHWLTGCMIAQRFREAIDWHSL